MIITLTNIILLLFDQARITEMSAAQKSLKAIPMKYTIVKKGGLSETTKIFKSNFSVMSPGINSFLMWSDLFEIRLLFCSTRRSMCGVSSNVKDNANDLELTDDIVALLDSKRKSIS